MKKESTDGATRLVMMEIKPVTDAEDEPQTLGCTWSSSLPRQPAGHHPATESSLRWELLKPKSQVPWTIQPSLESLEGQGDELILIYRGFQRLSSATGRAELCTTHFFAAGSVFGPEQVVEACLEHLPATGSLRLLLVFDLVPPRNFSGNQQKMKQLERKMKEQLSEAAPFGREDVSAVTVVGSTRRSSRRPPTRFYSGKLLGLVRGMQGPLTELMGTLQTEIPDCDDGGGWIWSRGQSVPFPSNEGCR